MGTVKRKTRDIPLQADKKAETEMTALPLLVTEGIVVTEGTVVMGMVQRAVAVGMTAKTETVTMMMRKKSPNTVAWEHAACRRAKRGMPPWKIKLHRQKNHRRTTLERQGPQPSDQLPKVQTRGKERSLIASIGIPPGPGAIYRPLSEESDTVPERGQKEASTVPSPYPQEGRREGSLTEHGLFT